jgi:hypothetical protein
MQCPGCGEWIDIRDLGMAFQHAGELPDGPGIKRLSFALSNSFSEGTTSRDVALREQAPNPSRLGRLRVGKDRRPCPHSAHDPLLTPVAEIALRGSFTAFRLEPSSDP